MRVRLDVILEFDDCVNENEISEKMTDIYDDLFDVAIDVDVINEEIIDWWGENWIMKIKMEDIKNEGFEIIEEVYNVSLETPVDLDSVGGDSLDDLDYGTYGVIKEEENSYCDVSETLFSLYKDGENFLLSVSLEEVKEYLNDYFENKGVK